MNIYEELKESVDKRKEQQSKYVYYIIALNVSAIGYAIHSSTGHSFNGLLFVWMISLVCWAISAYSGLAYLRKHIYSFHIDSKIKSTALRASQASNDDAYDEMSELADKIISEQSGNIDDQGRFFKRQNRYFFLGILGFVVWHLLEMFCKTYYCTCVVSWN